MAKAKTFFLDQHGCAKNQVDGEIIITRLVNLGLVQVSNADDADLIIVNSCGFIESAKKESLDSLLNARSAYPEKKIILAGCLAERYAQVFKEDLPEADGIVGNGDLSLLDKAVKEVFSKAKKRPVFKGEQKGVFCGERTELLSYKGSAFVKITEGCDNCCAYCIIPKIRGGFRSKPMEDVVEEARQLAEAGCKELILIAQDVTNYGRDLYGEPRLAELVRKVCRVDGIRWVRLMYCYEDRITDKLIEVMATEPKVCHYIDIPIQHASDGVLKAMRRRSTEESIKDTIKRLKAAIPDIHIRTTLIVGFPGETEKDFDKLLDFVEEMRFARLGVFAYSQEENTEAGEMENQIDEKIKRERLDAVMRRQLDISLEYNKEKVGKELEVLVEEADEDGSYIGRTQYDAPEIDNSVIFTSERELKAGDIVRVLVEDAFDYDLVGREV